MNRPMSFAIAPFTPVIKWLIIINVAIWFGLQIILESILKIPVSPYLSLVPTQVIFDYQIWQTFSYMFLHSPQVTHILFNMLMLWFFGGEVEQTWGSKKFLRYYLFTGVGAALIYCLGMLIYALVTGDQRPLVVPVVGASGALFGVMLAYGMLFGDRTIFFMMLFPMKARTFVILMGLVEFANMVTNQVSGSEVAYLAHLGGLIMGFLYIWFERWNQRRGARQAGGGKKGRHLSLVVDNDKKSNEPRYWN